MTQIIDDNPQAGSGRPLPKKEADLFRGVVKHYEMKQYKKAIKQADAVLKKFPKHGETLAMKGLTLNYMSKREEAHALVKEALAHDMRSHVCWHVYGLLYRSDRKYNEAIKAYKQALRIDMENLQILRDLSMLQIQMRDLDGFAASRNTLLSLKPNAKINWMAFAMARHMTGDLEGAVKVIDIYLGTLSEGSSELGRCYESSELALYRNSILAEIPNNYKAALDHLVVCENIVLDRGAWLMRRAEYQLKLHDFSGARNTVLDMFERGMTEDHRIHSLYMCALLELTDDSICDEALRLSGTRTLATMKPLTIDEKDMIRKVYETQLLPRFSTSHAVQRIPMAILEGDDLRHVLDQRCRKELSKGVPSLCSELQSFLLLEVNGRYTRPTDPVDIKAHPVYRMIVKMIDGYAECLATTSKFSSNDEYDEPPSTLLWTWFLRAGLHEIAGEYSDGITLSEKCLEHTPTAVDVYELKARLLKSGGDIKAAVECLDKGRELDRQDRYINNQTTKYMLQAGMEEEALKRISLFTRDEGQPEKQLFDMQCSWYELELAACLAQKKEWGRSLKKYSAVVKHFDDINEDQFDFHAYCLRKVTLRSYVSVLRFEDRVYGEDYYCAAASGIVRIYLNLFDNPLEDDTAEPDYTKMSAAERKKAKAVARKKKKTAEKKEADKIEAENNSKNAKGGSTQLIDEDPFGKEFLNKDVLDEARKFSATLARYAPKRLDSWILQYDVAIRRKKVLMALQALYKARAIDPDSSELFTRIVDFAGKKESFNELRGPTRTVLDDALPTLLDNHSVEDFVESAATMVRKSSTIALPFRTAVAQALVGTKAGSAADAAALITTGGMDSKLVTVQTCLDAHAALKTFGAEAAAAKNDWATAIQQRFPLLPAME